MPSNAYQTFEEMIGNVDQLIQIHGRLQAGRGRRHQQEAIHHAGVVMSVGAWEAFVENILREAIRALSNNLHAAAAGTPLWAKLTFDTAMHGVETKIRQFNTPNAENVQRLFREGIGFNPWPYWSWRVGRRQWDQAEMRRRLNSWLRIRHGIAHGTGLPAEITWIHDNNVNPRLTKKLLEECRNFVKRLSEQTDQSLRQFLIADHGIPAPW